MSLLRLCLLKLQNNNITFRNIRKILSNQICSLHSRKELYRIANLRYFITNNVSFDCDKQSLSKIKADGRIVKKSKLTSPIILMTKLNGNIEKLPLSDAERFAKRNNLILEKVKDGIKFPEYRILERSKQLQEISKEKTSDKKKTIFIKTKATEHDVQIKINYIMKLLKKNKAVSLSVIGDNENVEKIEELINVLMKNFGTDYKIENKKIKQNFFTCNIVPHTSMNANVKK